LQQDARQQRVEDQRAEAERELAEQRAQDEALQAYLDQMSQLMLDRKLLETEEGDPVHTLAQARTSTVILRLDAEHNESVARFLIDSGLAVSSEASARLLSEITLSHATLSDAQLPNADLRGADLTEAKLRDANLYQADLSDTLLVLADLSDANLYQVVLRGADLREANGVTNEELEQQAASLKRARMPDGSKHP
jgi:Pentapeptide repeats (8 copies)